MIKLIATDMDGTLLDDKGLLDKERFGRVLDQLEERQIPFVVASGNNISRLLAIFEGFEDRLVFVSDNGARLYVKGETLYRHTFSDQQLATLLQAYGDQAAAYHLMLSDDETIYMAEGADYPFDENLAIEPAQWEAFKARIRFVPDLRQVAAQTTIYKIGLWVPEAQVDAVVEAFNQANVGDLYAVTSGYGSIDILQVGIHKAWGLEQVIRPLGIAPEEVMAFGDSDNDLEMLAYVGHAYAMENASERVKAAADHLAPHHAEGGVLTVLEEYINRG